MKRQLCFKNCTKWYIYFRQKTAGEAASRNDLKDDQTPINLYFLKVIQIKVLWLFDLEQNVKFFAKRFVSFSTAFKKGKGALADDARLGSAS